MSLSHLGQSGFRLRLGASTVYVDPYLSDSVEKLHGPNWRRQRPAPLRPEGIRDADLVLVSHAHLDHCDPDTLEVIAHNNPDCRFMASYEAAKVLADLAGIAVSEILIADEGSLSLEGGAAVHAVPAAHPTIDRDHRGCARCLGFVIEYAGVRVYHAGDGGVHQEVIDAVRRHGPIDTALLPVNECNFFRERQGIIGNMSVREAFGLAVELGARRLVPMHFDMFAPNSVYEEEIELLYRRMAPPFRLDMPSLDMSWTGE
jgi:L-ascorbate metabolism protein UlaG (beta-lactamase superfamily)